MRPTPGTSVRFGTRTIGPDQPPFIIAELSGNHNRSLERALALVDAAAEAGADAVKLQTYTPETMTLDLDAPDFVIDDPQSLWNRRKLFELYEEAHTPWEWHPEIFARCRERGLLAFSTPFDETAVDFLESLDVPGYKIASFEVTDLPLIRKVASRGRPMIISTGMATLAELDECVQSARGAGCEQIVLLKCTSTYPASPANSNLLTIPHLRKLFGLEVGLSDHTLGIGVAVAAVALGASVIEKHLTLARRDGGVDAAFSLEPDELALLVREARAAWEARGEVHYGAVASEVPSLKFRRSIYISADMRAGEIFTTDNLRIVRPGNGLPPKFYPFLLGKRIRADAKRGTPTSWELVG
jgi:pseudaminic acid synthase